MTELNAATVEHVLCDLWGEHFGHPVSPHDDFYDLGGDSLGMIDIVAQARALGLPVRSSLALRNPSPAQLAEALTALRPQSIVAGTGPALYVVHSGEDATIASWDSPRPVKGFPLSATADEVFAALRLDQPEGPYFLAGLGDGAASARELGRRLRALGETVALLAVVEPPGDDILLRKALHQ